MPGPARFPRRCDERSTTATAVAASRAAGSGSARAITSVTGPRVAPPRYRILPCSVAGTTAPSTRRATSVDRQADGELRFRRPGRPALCPRSHRLPRCPAVSRTGPLARGTERRGSPSGRHARTATRGLGCESAWTWAGAVDGLRPPGGRPGVRRSSVDGTARKACRSAHSSAFRPARRSARISQAESADWQVWAAARIDGSWLLAMATSRPSGRLGSGASVSPHLRRPSPPSKLTTSNTPVTGRLLPFTFVSGMARHRSPRRWARGSAR